MLQLAGVMFHTAQIPQHEFSASEHHWVIEHVPAGQSSSQIWVQKSGPAPQPPSQLPDPASHIGQSVSDSAWVTLNIVVTLATRKAAANLVSTFMSHLAHSPVLMLSIDETDG
jgi:hypothetical protein